jgi:peptidoglycan/LPS O-acetylase OafA/YrhL
MPFTLHLHSPSQNSPRNFGLDLVRVVAIALVFYSHAISGVVKGVLIGDLGVELFFVLSGFLVGRYFFTGAREYNTSFAFRFMAKRWLRTLPLYYVVIFAKMLLTQQTFSDTWFYTAFIQNYISLSFFPVSWSLCIEEWFYLLLPLMALLIIRNSSHVRRIMLCIAVIYGIELFLRSYAVSENTSWEAIMSTIHLRMDSLLTGVALVFIKHEYAGFYHKLKSRWVFCFALLATALFLYAFADAYLASRLNTLIFFRVFGFTVLSVCIALLFPFIETISIAKEKFPGRLISWLIVSGSILTYSFYLVHSEVIDYVSTFGFGRVEKTACAFFVSLILSWLLYLCVERPFLKMKDMIKIGKS